MIVALYSLSYFLNRFASVNRIILWLTMDVIALTFGIGFLLVMGTTNLRKVVEVLFVVFFVSLIIPVPLPEDIYNVVIGLWALLIILGYVAYTKRIKLKDKKSG